MPKIERLSKLLGDAAVSHLSAADPVMRRMIETVGPFSFKPRRNHFHTLVRAIISQQISTAAARSILARLERAIQPDRLTAESLARLTVRQMRPLGVSPQKQVYLKDLARHVLEGRLRLDRLGRMPDEDVIADLIQVKGIGCWTAQMYLIFTLGRPNVFPHDDLGVRTAIRRAYGLAELPDQATSHMIAAAWRPYATVGSWYCWRSLALPSDAFAEPKKGIKSARAAGR